MQNKIIISKNNIIKVQSIEKGILTGYDVLTEEFVQIKDSDCMEITEKILSLLGSVENRVKLTSAMPKNQIEKARILGVSERSVLRLENQYINYDTNRTCKHTVNNSQLSAEEIKSLRDDHKLGTYTYEKLSFKYNVSVSTTRRVVGGIGKFKYI